MKKLEYNADSSQTAGSVSRLREIESSLPIGYTLIETDTLREASNLIALEFGDSSPLSRRINRIIKNGLPC